MKNLITDEELERVFRNTNFGPNPNFRELLVASVFKKCLGYNCGHTITIIMQELDLIGKTGKLKCRGIDLLRESYDHLLSKSG